MGGGGLKYIQVDLTNLSAANKAALVAALIENAINTGTLDKSPTENAVYDALALKNNKRGLKGSVQAQANGFTTI